MAIGESISPRMQACSQRRLQMRPQTAGNGFSNLIILQRLAVFALRGELDITLNGEYAPDSSFAG
jgi:hypothetical protein